MKTCRRRIIIYILVFIILHSHALPASSTIIDVYAFNDDSNRRFFLKEFTPCETRRDNKVLNFFTLQGTIFTPDDAVLPYFTFLQAYLFYYNTQIFNFFQHNISPEMKKISSYISYLGSGWVQVPIFAISYLLGDDKCKRFAVMGAKAFVLSGVQAQLYKHLIGNERPWNVTPCLGLSIENDSFPSGHATAVFSFAETYSSVFSQKVYPYVVAAMIGVARICEGAHWPADVLAGAYLGYRTAGKICKIAIDGDGREGGQQGEKSNRSFSHLLWQFDSFFSMKNFNFYGARFKIFSDIYTTFFDNFHIKFGAKYDKETKEGFSSSMSSEVQFLYNINTYLMPNVRCKIFQRYDKLHQQQIYAGNSCILSNNLLLYGVSYDTIKGLHLQMEYYSTAWFDIKYNVSACLPVVAGGDVASPVLSVFMKKKINFLEINFLLSFHHGYTSFEGSILVALYRNFYCEAAYYGDSRVGKDDILFSWLIKL